MPLCCELLSNLYLCIGFYNQLWYLICFHIVVNCFQICIFVSGFTTFFQANTPPQELWIAFKFVSLYRVLQLFPQQLEEYRSCELLSNLYLCIGFYNRLPSLPIPPGVVNCFQICIFVSGFTTEPSDISFVERCELLSNLYLCIGFYNDFCTNRYISSLWIAFKFVSLYRVLQHESNFL